ncbi:MAG: hypothetical protein O7F73_19040, partial [Gammaproteobacteria bacterium]|nr:hypothetical protein [Gammaproteobacteria bacterium]
TRSYARRGKDELHTYFAGIVDKYELREHIRLNCPVTSTRYTESDKRRQVLVEQGGQRETLDAARRSWMPTTSALTH